MCLKRCEALRLIYSALHSVLIVSTQILILSLCTYDLTVVPARASSNVCTCTCRSSSKGTAGLTVQLLLQLSGTSQLRQPCVCCSNVCPDHSPWFMKHARVASSGRLVLCMMLLGRHLPNWPPWDADTIQSAVVVQPLVCCTESEVQAW
jgi:hypothetical protein